MADGETAPRHKVALAHQILYLEGASPEDTLGHVSGYLPVTSVACLKPWGMGFEEAAPGTTWPWTRRETRWGAGRGGYTLRYRSTTNSTGPSRTLSPVLRPASPVIV